MLKKYRYLCTVSGLVILLDQATKILVRALLIQGEIYTPLPFLEGKFEIVHWKNTGMFMGVLEGYGILFTLLAIGVALAGLFIFPRLHQEAWSLRLGFSLQFGGVIGNLIDRLTVGYVTDFLAIGDLPVMNLADIALYLGLLILAASVLLRPERSSKQAETAGGDPQA